MPRPNGLMSFMCRSKLERLSDLMDVPGVACEFKTELEWDLEKTGPSVMGRSRRLG